MLLVVTLSLSYGSLGPTDSHQKCIFPNPQKLPKNIIRNFLFSSKPWHYILEDIFLLIIRYGEQSNDESRGAVLTGTPNDTGHVIVRVPRVFFSKGSVPRGPVHG